ncbi:MAG: A/G-specific adenine glycosylase [Planctomycetota bacterium]
MSKQASKAKAELLAHDPCWRQSPWRSRTRKRLVNWFREHARELPWRSNPLPYNVWVSEIMLQQTQVATVLPYFHRWMNSFPTVQSLADAEEPTLMKHWEGLGYYRRVRSMHAAAKKIVAEHDGVFPTRFDDVLALPGVGRYTAGAVASISQDQRKPVLEGNTQRVFSRWVALQTPPTQPQAAKLLWEIAEAMLPRTKGSGEFNQAAMELGALVCTPKKPRCDICPVSSSCRANKLGLQDEIPGKIKAIQYENRTEFALVVRNQKSARYLVRPLPAKARWAGLWDFPRATDESTRSVEQATGWLAEQLGVQAKDIEVGDRLKTIRHAVTKYRITLNVHDATLNSDAGTSRLPEPWQWLSLDELSDKPLSVSGRKIAKWLVAS